MRNDTARLFGLAAACLAVWASHATAATTRHSRPGTSVTITTTAFASPTTR